MRKYAAFCRECGVRFPLDEAAPSRKTCPEHTPKLRIVSREARARQRDNRRARERAAYVADVSRYDVYQRDDWTCQICGSPVDRNAVVPDPSAPTLDHTIALADGGTHEPGNVQLAHFMCNSRKGATEGGGAASRRGASHALEHPRGGILSVSVAEISTPGGVMHPATA